jgi:peptidyl-prolyl cis-trans isomerase A (cyclophilin A)
VFFRWHQDELNISNPSLSFCLIYLAMKILLITFLYIIVPFTLLAQPADTLQLLSLKAPAIYQVEIKTSLGNFIVEVEKQDAPLAADRFYQLVKSGFYNDSRLFRSTTKYLQFGIANDSAVNAFWDRYPMKDEQLQLKNEAFTISFATPGVDGRTTSVYFNKIDNPRLDTSRGGKAFPAFGKIVQGKELLQNFQNKYADSVVFKHWDNMTVKGNAYTDKVLPGLEKIYSITLLNQPADKLKPDRQRKD